MITFPSLAMCSGSNPRISQIPRTSSRTGTSFSRNSMRQPDCSAISARIAPRPPRVGSRMQWMLGLASRIVPMRPLRGAESERISEMTPSSLRLLRTAAP